ncbi:heterokaryon incompatibility protein-domain-containing protein [Trametes polyzona]|nr:heterokaryon incompatibility protein-domain-containing protein [Trametes polyzona]
MWLLSTSHFELVHFNKPEDVVAGSSPDNKPGYAILSHVWARDGTEQSFANIERLFAQGITTYEDPRVSDKIRGCVRAAREHGFGWVWDDTCCIDKRSSAELEEAINSMFSWYAKAGICLAYLADVPDDCLPEDPNSAFRRSAWFKRGWTLQELVAPHCLIFLSENWRYLGTKVGLADLLQEITGIESDVLTFHRALQHVSVARRMSWASQRETSRVEDRAYSLLGIFDVSMATIYGEGANAFRRLQMEIMNRHPDHTLFAWGEMWAPGDNGSMSTMAPLNGRNGKTVPQNRSRPLKLGGRFTPPLSEKSNSPFASSPSDFQYAAMSPISLEDTVKRVREWLNITLSDSATAYEHLITSSGVRFQFIVVSGQPFSLAILLCQNDANQCVALPLWPQNEHRPQHYRVGAVKEGTLYRVFPICGTTLHSLRESGWRPQTDSDSAAVSIGRTPNHPNHRNRSCSPLTGSLRNFISNPDYSIYRHGRSSTSHFTGSSWTVTLPSIRRSRRRRHSA